MKKQEIYKMLERKGIAHEITEHEAVFNMEELNTIELPYPESDGKNLFLRDDKKRNYYLVTVRGDKKVDLKAFRAAHGTRALSFASPADLEKLLKLTPGSVTPLGLLNDEERKVKLFLDREFFEKGNLIGVHPNDNTATLWLAPQDLADLIEGHGNEVEIIEI